MSHPTRVEHDLIGERQVPVDAYYGVHTLRALENFPITGTAISIYPDLVVALACVKQAAAQPGTQPAARDALLGLDAICERQRREDAAKKQQK